MSTRVFRRRYGRGPYFVSTQVSFTDKRSALQFAKALDRLKAEAALGRRLLALVGRVRLTEPTP